MECPSCGKTAPAGAAECPACGVVFAKWEKREKDRDEERKREEAAALAALESPAAAPADPWVGRGIAAAIAAAWMIAFGLYFRHRYARRPPAFTSPTGEFVEFRDPKTGETRRMPVLRMQGVPQPPAAPQAAPPQSDSEPEPAVRGPLPVPGR